MDLPALAAAAGVPASVVGTASGQALSVHGVFSLPLQVMRDAHEGWLPAYMGETAA